MPFDRLNLPFTGDVNLFGKSHTIKDNEIRKGQNLITDGIGNLKRRGAMSFQAVLWAGGGSTAVALRADDGSSTAITGTYPIWAAFLKDGVIVCMTTNGERCDLLFGTHGDPTISAHSINFNMDVPGYLPCMYWIDGVAYILYGPNRHQIGSGPLNQGPGILKIEFPDDGSLDVNGAAIPYKVTDITLNDASNAALTPRLATVLRQRVWYANFGDTGDLGSTVLVSDINDPLTVGVNAITDRNFIIGSGGKLTGWHAVMLQGGGDPTTGAILALKRNGAWLLTGEPTETDDPDYFGTLDVKEISSKAGCVSNDSICDTDWGTIWCGPDDVWIMPFGSVPIPIGKKLKPLLLAQPKDQEYRIHAVIHDGFYRLSLFSDGQGPDHDTPLGEQWWLDLREGPPENWESARWCGPQVFKPQCILANKRLTALGAEPSQLGYEIGTSFMMKDQEDPKSPLYGIQLAVANDLSATHDYTPPPDRGFCLVAYDAPNNRDVAGRFAPALIPWVAGTYNVGDQVVVIEQTDDLHPSLYEVIVATGAQATGGSEPNWASTGPFGIADGDLLWYRHGYVLSPSGAYGSEILTVYESKQYNAGSALNDKLWVGGELSIISGAAQALQLLQIVDAGKTTESIIQGFNRMSGPVVGDTQLFTNFIPNFSEEAQAVAFDSIESRRVIGKTYTARISDNPGIYLPSLTFYVFNGTAEVAVDLTESYFVCALELATAMALAMTNNATLNPQYGTFSVTTDEDNAKIGIRASSSTWIPWALVELDFFNIWSIIGHPYIGQAAAQLQTGSEIPYDMVIGSLSLREGAIGFRQHRRRPL